MFVTNDGLLVKELMENIFPTVDNLYFLVGYFYFSGFEKLYDTLRDKNLKILVGMEVDKDIYNNLIEIDYKSKKNITKSNNETRKDFFDKFVKIYNETDYFDSTEKEESFKLFLEKLKNGTLEIRKTIEPNHAKLYLFENKEGFNQGGSFPGTIITGSSNLTFSGLSGRKEINIVLRDKLYYEEAKKIFDELWESSIEIVGKNTLSEFNEEVIPNIWFQYDKNIKEEPYLPYLTYIRVIYEYFYLEENRDIKYPFEITKKFFNLKYQSDAVKMAIKTLNTHNGVIISDVVGLGKSIIASTVAFNLKLPVIIISPPHLTEQWKEYKRIFGFNGEVFSNGKLETIIDNYKDLMKDKVYLVIIDEAHKFRNEETITYANLHKITQGNKVMLLTATPFSNKPEDIFSMIKLFQIPGKSTIQTTVTLSEEFRNLMKEYRELKKQNKNKSLNLTEKKIEAISKKIKNILAPLIIRRTRMDLEKIKDYKEDLKKQKISFSEVMPPQDSEYILGVLETLYLKTLNKIMPEISTSNQPKRKGFRGTRYKPVAYLKDFKKYEEIARKNNIEPNQFKTAQNNISLFMKRMLVRRFESSVYAFKLSLKAMIRSSENMLDWYENGTEIPILKKGNIPNLSDFWDYEEEIKEFTDTLEFKTWKEKNKDNLIMLPKETIKKTFADDLKSDIKLLKGIYKEWFPYEKIEFDPKLDKLKELLTNWQKQEKNRKIIIFTEFSDTANYLYGELKENFKVFKYTSKDANTKNKEIIKLNFDASVKENQKNDYDILIATDAISEGYNLNRAGRIVNYDIPYNPTRVIQRIGRINRIGKKVFDKLYIHNYFPSSIGERETATKQISTFKMAIIKAILGGDTRILTGDEEIKPYLDEKSIKYQDDNEESWDVEYRNLLNEVKNTKILKKALKIPKRVKFARKSENNKGSLIFGKKGNEYITKFYNGKEIVNLSKEETLNLFKAEKNERTVELSKDFQDIYLKLKNEIFKTENTKKIREGDKKFAEVIDKIEFLIENTDYKKYYLEDLKKVFDKLDGLPKYYQKIIRKQDFKNDLKEIIDEIERQIPKEYIRKVLKTAKDMDMRDETLIFAEELR